MESSTNQVTTSEMLAGIGALLDSESAGYAGGAGGRLNLAVVAVRLADRLAAVAQRLVADAEKSDAGMIAAGVSVKSVLVGELKLTPRAAGGLVRRSVAVAERPVTLAAAESGEINSDQARVIVRAVDSLPEAEVTAEQVDAGEATLIGLAADFHAGALQVLGGRLLEVVAPAEADKLEEIRLEREWRAAQQGRFLQFRDDGHGTTALSGLLPTTSAALVRAQLDAYVAAARRAELDGDADRADDRADDSDRRASVGLPVTPAGIGRRRADALVAMAEQCAVERVPPAIAGDRPRVLVLMGYDNLLEIARDHAARLVQAGTPNTVAAGPGSASANGRGALGSKPSGLDTRPPHRPEPDFVSTHDPVNPHDPGNHDPGNPHDSLAPAGAVDSVAGVAAQLLSGERVPAGVLRRWLCDAELLPVVLGGESVVLDVGRARRFATPAQRVALTVRDRGCVFPGCDTPAPLCEAHHIEQWHTGGPTDLANLALLCWHHHAVCEPGRPARDQWLIKMVDGVPAAIPPARLDPTRRPRTHERFLKPIRPG